ncbi:MULTISPECIES: GntR family transcriptional regulator [unclassified Paenibacillus]|uniref:GntR family transcriptional regulator n=1 Tax=unclassified Paenibacillus TaxID=185978 RepID=UPI00048CBD26|nr:MULTISPECIES: GntR family transcriptional regulator [unclassified Paenibacillus]SDF12440.1 GntR family transcriptional regulator, arabinose operon transcriptional repressor [Paenibacillus sp. cl6col]
MSYDSRSPLYLQVQRYIEDMIHTKQLKTNDRIPTEKELMEQFQVSRITVVNALAALVKEGLIYRVPGRGSFVAEPKSIGSSSVRDEQAGGTEGLDVNGAGSGNQERRRNVVGFMMPTLDDYFAMRLINSIQQTLNERGYSLIVAFSGGSKEREEQQIREMLDMGISGLLLFPVDEDIYNEEILSLKVNGFPFVLIDRYLPGVDTHYVCSDNRKGAEMAVAHLWELGHRNIAICTDAFRDCVSVQDRIAGYMNEYQRRGAMINPALILTDFTLPVGEEADDSVLARYMKSEMATAYIALHGKLGMRMHQIAKRAGLRVPEDISIVTFDDPEHLEERETFFSHIYQNEAQIGRRAATILADIMERSDQEGQAGKEAYHKVILEPQFVNRRSTGPCQSEQ